MGLGIFGAANAASGLAGSSDMMLVARLMSGVGAAMIMPVTMAVITATFPDEERSKAIDVWTGVAGGGGQIISVVAALGFSCKVIPDKICKDTNDATLPR